MKTESQFKYLGVALRQDCGTHSDIIGRLAKARSGFNKLQKLWKHTDIITHWKLRVCNSTFVPTLTYGMESATITQPQAKRLNAFHSQCLRKTHNIKATYYTEVLNPQHTTTTNQEILTISQQPNLTDIIHSQQLKLLGHILRAPHSDLTNDVCFTYAYVRRGKDEETEKGKKKFSLGRRGK